MDKVVTTALLMIAGVVGAIVIFNTVYPMLTRSSQAMVSMSDTMDDRMKSRINIVHAANESDRLTVYIWIKNVGSSRIVTIKESDLFFGQETDFGRIPHVDDAGGGKPSWDFAIENDTEWLSSATVKVTVTYTSDPGAATYFVKFIIPNGISDEYFFSM